MGSVYGDVYDRICKESDGSPRWVCRAWEWSFAERLTRLLNTHGLGIGLGSTGAKRARLLAKARKGAKA